MKKLSFLLLMPCLALQIVSADTSLHGRPTIQSTPITKKAVKEEDNSAKGRLLALINNNPKTTLCIVGGVAVATTAAGLYTGHIKLPAWLLKLLGR